MLHARSAGRGDNGRYPRFRAALALPSAGVEVVCIGDSITAGLRASVDQATDPAQYAVNGWVALLRAYYQARYGDGGYGFIPVFTGSPASAATNSIVYPFLWVPSGTWTEFTDPYAFGPFGRALYASGNTNTLTLTTPACSAIDLHTFRTDLTSAAWTYTVDGGSPVSVSQTVTDGSIVYVKTTISSLSLAAHTIVITAPASGNVHVVGANCRKGAGGVRFHNIGRGGDKAINYGVSAEAPRWVSGLAPHLTICALTVNDQASDLTAVQAALQRLADAAQGSDLLFIGPNPIATLTTTKQYDLHETMRSVAEGNGGRFLDLMPFFGTGGAMAALGDIDGSALHPLLTGHSKWAARVLQELPA